MTFRPLQGPLKVNYFSRLRLWVSLSLAWFWLCYLWPIPALADAPSFETFRGFGEVEKTQALAVGDLNGDGALDIVTVDGSDPDDPRPDYFYLNDGTGNFSAGFIYNPVEDGAVTVALGDLNGDGLLDIVTGSEGQLSRIFLNNGNDSFGTGIPLGNVAYTQAIAIGDLNGDGHLDIVQGNPDQASRIFLNNGAGSFGSGTPLSGNSDLVEGVALGDLNGDGDLDIVLGRDGEVSQVYRNTGSGTFDGGADLDISRFTQSVVLGDLDDDGDLDLIQGNFGQPNRVYTNDGNGNFSVAYDFPDTEPTLSLALGDINGDGNLDLLVGNDNYRFRYYLNDGVGDLTFSGSPFGSSGTRVPSVALADLDNNGSLDPVLGRDGVQSGFYVDNILSLEAKGDFGGDDITTEVAVADINRDKQLDLVVGNRGDPSLVYLNLGDGQFFANPVNCAAPPASVRCLAATTANSVAVGDLNGDNALDIVVGNELEHNLVYLNNGSGTFPATGDPFGGEDNTNDLTLGDLNGDGSLDLVVGNYREPSLVYFNNGAGQFFDGAINCAAPPASVRCLDDDQTNDITVGDLNGDGSLDIVTGNNLEQGRIYLNDGAGNFGPGKLFGNFDVITSVSLSDLDGDGRLDLVTGSYFGQNQIYLNDGQGNFTNGTPLGISEGTVDIQVADFNGDGWSDIAVGNDLLPDRLFLNEGLGRFTRLGTTFGADRVTGRLAVGDLNGDGTPDLVESNYAGSGSDRVYFNRGRRAALLPNNPPFLAVSRPVATGNANFYSTPLILSQRFIPVTYTLFDPESDPARRLAAFYSLDGGGHWFPAVPAPGTPVTNLTTRPYPTVTVANTHVFTWDTFASGVLGQSDNVVLRFEVYSQPAAGGPAGSYTYLRQAAGPFQWPYNAAQTFPFRVQGTQVRVLNGTTPVSKALVYRLPAGQAKGGFPLADSQGVPFRTDSQGYLTGRGQVGLGDQLLALLPVSLPLSYTLRYSDQLHLYYINATPTVTGLNAHTVTQPGVQTLVVSPNKPLLLFDLEVALEWDASDDPTYLQQLTFDLGRASEFFYDFTDGQVALGEITVHQNGDNWNQADIVVQATNRLRPFAVQGGIVLTETTDPDHADIEYDIGQVVMGATWNRYGEAGQNLGQDWPLTLAHELGHYLLFLDDVYLGLENNLLIPIDDCTGSAMGDVYVPNNTEFLTPAEWPKCDKTLAHVTLERSEWETIRLWYPWLKMPQALNSGPGLMPFNLTEITLRAPLTPTNSLEDPTFYLDYKEGGVSSSAAHGIVFVSQDSNPATYEAIIDLGSPVSGQNRLLARGVQPGERLCVFDPARQHYGCEVIAAGDERLHLEQDMNWKPLIRLSPVNSTSFTLAVETVSSGLSLQARLYPEFGPGSSTITLSPQGNGRYQGTFNLSSPALAGHVQLWVNETATEADPRREMVVAYAISGNIGDDRIAGPAQRGRGGNSRGGGPAQRGRGGGSRGGGAPLVSPDGQLIFFTENPIIFEEGDFYTVQNVGTLPPLPGDKVALGPGYSLVATPGAPVITGSISFQYLGLDALQAKIDEEELTIHFWDGNSWQALPTVSNAYYNLASTFSQGPGIYALVAGITPPTLTGSTPLVATTDVATPLVISGSNFLEPVRIVLIGASQSYTLPAQFSSPTTVSTLIPPGFVAQEYSLKVINSDGGAKLAPATLGLYDPEAACFYDRFGSGANKWQRSYQWAVARLPNGEQAITDSPAGNYAHALPPVLTQTYTITSTPFSLAACGADPVLTFRHDYLLAKVGNSQDLARVEISSDGGSTWQELARYTGGGIYGAAQEPTASEWVAPAWKGVEIDLSGYTGTARLRFALEVDQVAADKGWVLDDIVVKSKSAASGPVFLPLLHK